ncbi:hypothetical protein [Sorangium sp. So ce362]|uniref:hypothetical protein n=1 Tax=Sorangium sp. So ce362 TaxID=3133303 RepID=UPI003F6460FE
MTDPRPIEPVERVVPSPELRQRAAELASGLAGMGGSTRAASRREEYLDLIAPGESPRMQAEMARMSGCALVAAGCWRALGVRHPLLAAPYAVGTAVSRLMRIGAEARAIRRPDPDAREHGPRELWAMPGPGDVVLVGSGANEHVFVVIEAGLRAGVPVIWALDGGQRDVEGYQLVECKEHVWTPSGAGAATRRVLDIARNIEPGRSWGAQREVVCWIDLDAVVARFGSC